jgi:hypothetical protein
MPSAAARHAEIERRYRKGELTPFSIATLRVAELRRLFRARYGTVLPDDDAGRDDALVMAHHLAKRPDAERNIRVWLGLWCPWMTGIEAAATAAKVIFKPLRWRADKLAIRLNLNEAERRRLRITTIGAVDLTKEQRKARRRARDRALKEARRRAVGAKLRAEYEANSLSRNKPWERLSMSRRSWYRAGKPLPGGSADTFCGRS